MTFAHLDIKSRIMVPQELEVPMNELTGIEVHVVQFLYNITTESYSLRSSAHVNTSLYNSNIIRQFSCGLFSMLSNSITLNFSIVSE